MHFSSIENNKTEFTAALVLSHHHMKIHVGNIGCLGNAWRVVSHHIAVLARLPHRRPGLRHPVSDSFFPQPSPFITF